MPGPPRRRGSALVCRSHREDPHPSPPRFESSLLPSRSRVAARKNFHTAWAICDSVGIGEYVCGAIPELAWNLDNIPVLPGQARNLVLPDLPADCGDGVAKVAVRLGVPGGGSWSEWHSGCQVVRAEGNEREQTKQSRSGAHDREVGPLALGFDAKMVAAFLERDLELPARDEPLEDIDRSGSEIGAEEGLRCKLAARIAGQHPSDGHGGEAAVVPDRGAGGDLDETIGAAVPESDGVTLPDGIGVLQDLAERG